MKVYMYKYMFDAINLIETFIVKQIVPINHGPRKASSSLFFRSFFSSTSLWAVVCNSERAYSTRSAWAYVSTLWKWCKFILTFNEYQGLSGFGPSPISMAREAEEKRLMTNKTRYNVSHLGHRWADVKCCFWSWTKLYSVSDTTLDHFFSIFSIQNLLYLRITRNNNKLDHIFFFSR